MTKVFITITTEIGENERALRLSKDYFQRREAWKATGIDSTCVQGRRQIFASDAKTWCVIKVDPKRKPYHMPY